MITSLPTPSCVDRERILRAVRVTKSNPFALNRFLEHPWLQNFYDRHFVDLLEVVSSTVLHHMERPSSINGHHTPGFNTFPIWDAQHPHSIVVMKLTPGRVLRNGCVIGAIITRARAPTDYKLVKIYVC